MQTVWSGYGLPAMNMVWTDVYVPRSVWVALQDIPQVPTRVALPPTTHGVCLWTPQDMAWYALDATPGPIPSVVFTTTVPASAFVLGGVVQPGVWHLFAIPDDSLSHELQLVSTVSNALILLTALTEMS
jgi:hypothetical protein